MLRACYKNRHFIVESIKREFASRYVQSMLGGVWAVINPLAMILVYTLVFSQVMRAKLPGIESGFAYSIYLCAGILPWGLFLEISMRCVNVFVENANMLKKIAFPKICLPIIVIGSALVNFSIISGLFLIFLLFIGQCPGWVLLGTIPLLVLLVIAAASIGIFLGTINVFFRDIAQIYGVICQFWFWMTPIVYPQNIIPEKFLSILEFNPMVKLIGSFQRIFLEQKLPEYIAMWPIIVGIILFALFTLTFYRRHANEIVDEL